MQASPHNKNSSVFLTSKKGSKIERRTTNMQIPYETIIDVSNVPEHAQTIPYFVVTYFDNQCWFYGAYKTKEKANAVQQILHNENPNLTRIVVRNPNATTE